MEQVFLVVHPWCVNYSHSLGSFLPSPVWVLPLPFLCMCVPKWVGDDFNNDDSSVSGFAIQCGPPSYSHGSQSF
jgi:hypothetical protein